MKLSGLIAKANNFKSNDPMILYNKEKYALASYLLNNASKINELIDASEPFAELELDGYIIKANIARLCKALTALKDD